MLRDAAELPAPENTYQLTSVAAPEVSGIVALLLERNRKLTPANLRRIRGERARGVRREASATTVSARGLVDPFKAHQLAESSHCDVIAAIANYSFGTNTRVCGRVLG